MQVYNLGYDASEDVMPKSGYAIHHPAGNIARISSFNQTACTPAQSCSGLQSDFEHFFHKSSFSCCLMCVGMTVLFQVVKTVQGCV